MPLSASPSCSWLHSAEVSVEQLAPVKSKTADAGGHHPHSQESMAGAGEAAFASQQGVRKPPAMLAWHQREGSPDFAQPTLTASSSATRKLPLENYIRVICFYQPEYWNQANTHTHAQMHADTHAWRYARTHTHTHMYILWKLFSKLVSHVHFMFSME